MRDFAVRDEASRIAVYEVQKARPIALDIADAGIKLNEELKRDSPDVGRLRRLVKSLNAAQLGMQITLSDYLAWKDLEKSEH